MSRNPIAASHSAVAFAPRFYTRSTGSFRASCTSPPDGAFAALEPDNRTIECSRAADLNPSQSCVCHSRTDIPIGVLATASGCCVSALPNARSVGSQGQSNALKWWSLLITSVVNLAIGQNVNRRHVRNVNRHVRRGVDINRENGAARDCRRIHHAEVPS